MDPWQIVAVLGGVISTIVGAFWLYIQKHITELRAERDKYAALLDLSLQNNRDAIAAWGKRDATDAARKRQTD